MLRPSGHYSGRVGAWPTKTTAPAIVRRATPYVPYTIAHDSHATPQNIGAR
jgi:hypothetical protein